MVLTIPDRACGGPMGPDGLIAALETRKCAVVREGAAPAVGDIGLVWGALGEPPPSIPRERFVLLVPERPETVQPQWRDLAQRAGAVATLDPTAAAVLVDRLGVTAIPVLGGGQLNLAEWPLLERDEARAALGVEPRRLLALTGPLGARVRVDILVLAHRKMAGTALFVVGTGVEDPRVAAHSAMTRPSSPVLHIPTLDAEARRIALAACDVAVHLDEGRLGQDAVAAAAMGRRLVALNSAAGLSALEAMYPGTDWPVCTEPTVEGLRAGVTKALEAPDPSLAAVQATRRTVGLGSAVDQLLEVFAECALHS
ncbi:MAG: hypothetical protein AAFU79_26920 [Myxococcota bacterium]